MRSPSTSQAAAAPEVFGITPWAWGGEFPRHSPTSFALLQLCHGIQFSILNFCDDSVRHFERRALVLNGAWC
eukprot:6176152-Pleurochrysis_carterae.AAC.1